MQVLEIIFLEFSILNMRMTNKNFPFYFNGGFRINVFVFQCVNKPVIVYGDFLGQLTNV